MPPNAVLANNSIILRLNHSKLTHFRRRQRHINYDSDVPKGPALWRGGAGIPEPEPEPCQQQAGSTLSLPLPFWGFFFPRFGKKSKFKTSFRPTSCAYLRQGRGEGREGGSLWVGTLSGAGRLIVGSKSYSAHSRERENGFS